VVVARIVGVDVRVRPSALLLFGTIAWLLATQLLPAAAPGAGPATAWLLGLAGAVLFEVGVVLHEVGHAVVARREGLRADAAELRLFGGVTEIDGQPASPRAQLRIAGIGPAVSLGYAAAIGSLTLLSSVVGLPAALVAVGVYVAIASAVIGLVNLLPGAPLDGGRLLQAWSWQRSGDRHRAGLTAVRCGRWVAALLIVAGTALTATGLLSLLGGLSVTAMGAMAWLGAGDEHRQLIASAEVEPVSPDGHKPARTVSSSRA